MKGFLNLPSRLDNATDVLNDVYMSLLRRQTGQPREILPKKRANLVTDYERRNLKKKNSKLIP